MRFLQGARSWPHQSSGTGANLSEWDAHDPQFGSIDYNQALMNSQTRARFEEVSVVEVSQQEVDRLLAGSEVIREENISISGPIRILRDGDLVFVQEQTPERKLLLRMTPSLEHANSFVDDRLAAYERMWDG